MGEVKVMICQIFSIFNHARPFLGGSVVMDDLHSWLYIPLGWSPTLHPRVCQFNELTPTGCQGKKKHCFTVLRRVGEAEHDEIMVSKKSRWHIVLHIAPVLFLSYDLRALSL